MTSMTPLLSPEEQRQEPFGWLFEGPQGLRQFFKADDCIKPVLELHKRMAQEQPGYTLTPLYAALLNLSRGVELGQTVWYVKATDAVEYAKAALGGAATPAPAVPAAQDILRMAERWGAESVTACTDGTTADIFTFEKGRLQLFINDVLATPAAVPVQPAKADSAAVQQGREAMQLALDAFDKMVGRKPDFVEAAIESLRAALAPTPQAPQPTERLVDEIAALRNVCQRVSDHKDFDAAWKYHMGRLEDHKNEEDPS